VVVWSSSVGLEWSFRSIFLPFEQSCKVAQK
jgi:hypothetical protein